MYLWLTRTTRRRRSRTSAGLKELSRGPTPNSVVPARLSLKFTQNVLYTIFNIMTDLRALVRQLKINKFGVDVKMNQNDITYETRRQFIPSATRSWPSVVRRAAWGTQVIIAPDVLGAPRKRTQLPGELTQYCAVDKATQANKTSNKLVLIVWSRGDSKWI
jgi:hypothetical protein